MEVTKCKSFANGTVYAMRTFDGYPIETTDTWLPYYTKDAASSRSNRLLNGNFGSRSERWMVGVSVMSGCPVRCKFCATGKLKKWRHLTAEEIVEQVDFAVAEAGFDPRNSKEFKINYTRMGEPFLNLASVISAILIINQKYGKDVHHYISTIGIDGADYTWISDFARHGINITLQLSLHSLDDARRDQLIPYSAKASIEELGLICVSTANKITLNLTLVDERDFDIERLKRFFPPAYFFIKLSPINRNDVSDANGLGAGIIDAKNLA